MPDITLLAGKIVIHDCPEKFSVGIDLAQFGGTFKRWVGKSEEPTLFFYPGGGGIEERIANEVRIPIRHCPFCGEDLKAGSP